MKKRGAKRAEGAVGGLVLDAGALVGLERRSLRVLADLELAAELGRPIRIPAAALAQVWRGGPRSAAIARLLRQPCDVIAVDERSAREIGEFIAVAGPADAAPDVVDAHVALTARATNSLILTSDPGDMRRYGVPEMLIRAI